MRNLFLSAFALTVLMGSASAPPAAAAPSGISLSIVSAGPVAETVQYYEPGWREREEWRRRREIEFRRREEWRRHQEWRLAHRGPPLPSYGYGPRY